MGTCLHRRFFLIITLDGAFVKGYGGRDWGRHVKGKGWMKGKGRVFFTKEAGVYGAGAGEDTGPYGRKGFVGAEEIRESVTGVLRQEQRERRPRRGAGISPVTAALELQVLQERGRAIDRIGAAAEQDSFACSL